MFNALVSHCHSLRCSIILLLSSCVSISSGGSTRSMHVCAVSVLVWSYLLVHNDEKTRSGGWAMAPTPTNVMIFRFVWVVASVTKWLTWRTDWSATVKAWERKRYFQPVNDWNNPTQQYILTKPLRSSPFQSFHPSNAIQTISPQGVHPMIKHYIPFTQSTALIGCITIHKSQEMEYKVALVKSIQTRYG